MNSTSHLTSPASGTQDALYSGTIDGLRGTAIDMTLAQARSASHQGQCDSDVASLAAHPGIAAQLDAIGSDTLRDSLRESGAWDAEDLADDAQNRLRAVWLAACDIREEAR